MRRPRAIQGEVEKPPETDWDRIARHRRNAVQALDVLFWIVCVMAVLAGLRLIIEVVRIFHG